MPTDELQDRLRTALGTAYSIERELGGGGMSRVFLARETALQRDVVVKVLSPELAAGVSAERFTREIHLAASLLHANIVPLLSAGEIDGLPYYTMPFVDGLSLSRRLERSDPPAIGEVMNVMRDVTRALAYAHAHGVVHRDIKPGNILLSGDAAVVTDFGIAKALAVSRTQEPSGTLTQAGTSIGTPAYMAPEQAAGDPATDHRADLYALGCVAYEMLGGTPPFVAEQPHQLLAAHLSEPPTPIAARRPGTPTALAELVMRCLEKDPAMRPQSAREVLEALDGVGAVTSSGGRRRKSYRIAGGLGVAAVAAAVIFGGRALRTRDASVGPTANAPESAAVATVDPRSIVVLPFENLGDSADAYFADGISDAVRGKLTALPGLTVIARASSVSYPPGKQPLDVVARQLGVRYLLTGTVRFAGAAAERRVQVSPELVDAAAGRVPESRWQQPFDAPMKHVFAVQAEIAGRVAMAMQGALGDAAQARLAEVPTRNPEAYDAFLRGEAIRYGGATDPRTVRRALAAYEEAVRHDSTMAPAWAGVSAMLALLHASSIPSPALASRALAAAERAVALDSTRYEGYAALTYYHTFISRDFVRAFAAASRARALAPRDAGAVLALARVEDNLAEFDAARRDLAEAARLDPRNSRVWLAQTALLLRFGRVAQARAAADRLLALAPTNLGAIRSRVQVELAAGDVRAARQVIARATRDVPREAIVAHLARYFDLGWVLDAEEERVLLSLGPDAFDGDRANFAIVRAQQYGWRGDVALARAWGDSAAREFAAQLRDAPTDPQLHMLRGLALGYAGAGRQALAEAERGLALASANRESAQYAYFVYVAARTALLAGDRDAALAWLAESQRAHHSAGPAWLRVEPTWKPLRGDPRFAALVKDASVGR